MAAVKTAVVITVAQREDGAWWVTLDEEGRPPLAAMASWRVIAEQLADHWAMVCEHHGHEVRMVRP